MKAVRAYLRRCKVVGVRLDHAHRKSTHSICVFKGAEMSRQSQRSARVVRAGSNEAQQAKNKRRPSSKPTASSTHPSCRLARVQSRVPSRHVAGSSSPLTVRRILILHQEAGSRGLSGAAVRLLEATLHKNACEKRDSLAPELLLRWLNVSTTSVQAKITTGVNFTVWSLRPATTSVP